MPRGTAPEPSALGSADSRTAPGRALAERGALPAASPRPQPVDPLQVLVVGPEPPGERSAGWSGYPRRWQHVTRLGTWSASGPRSNATLCSARLKRRRREWDDGEGYRDRPRPRPRLRARQRTLFAERQPRFPATSISPAADHRQQVAAQRGRLPGRPNIGGSFRGSSPGAAGWRSTRPVRSPTPYRRTRRHGVHVAPIPAPAPNSP